MLLSAEMSRIRVIRGVSIQGSIIGELSFNTQLIQSADLRQRQGSADAGLLIIDLLSALKGEDSSVGNPACVIPPAVNLRVR